MFDPIERQQRFEHMLHSEVAAVDIGLGALKAVVTVNAGALLVLLAFIGQLWQIDRAEAILVAGSCLWFLWGTAAGVLSFPVAYFHQSCFSAILVCDVEFIRTGINNDAGRAFYARWKKALAILMIALPLVSFALFCCGVFNVFSQVK